MTNPWCPAGDSNEREDSLEVSNSSFVGGRPYDAALIVRLLINR